MVVLLGVGAASRGASPGPRAAPAARGRRPPAPPRSSRAGPPRSCAGCSSAGRRRAGAPRARGRPDNLSAPPTRSVPLLRPLAEPLLHPLPARLCRERLPGLLQFQPRRLATADGTPEPVVAAEA